MKCDKGDSYYVTKGNFGGDTCNEEKLREQLVEKKHNLNSFSFKHYHYYKTKRLVQKACPSIAREIETQQKKRLDST